MHESGSATLRGVSRALRTMLLSQLTQPFLNIFFPFGDVAQAPQALTNRVASVRAFKCHEARRFS